MKEGANIVIQHQCISDNGHLKQTSVYFYKNRIDQRKVQSKYDERQVDEFMVR
jgi:hypothetical protein